MNIALLLKNKKILAGVLIILLIAGFLTSWNLNNNLEKQKVVLKKLQNKEFNLKSTRASFLEEFAPTEYVPETMQASELLKKLNITARDTKVNIVEITQGKSVNVGGLYSMDLMVIAQGPPENMLDFTKDFEKIPRLMKINSWQIEPSENKYSFVTRFTIFSLK